MGSSNNFYQQALHENKLLQMKILELKHKAALYEVCLGSIASILKDLPLQQNINDTKLSQNAALHKIANVLTHIESVVKSNSESQLHRHPAHSLAHNPLHQHPPKVQFSWPGNNSNAVGRPLNGPHFPPTETFSNSTNLPPSANLVHGEPLAQPSFNKAVSPSPLEPNEYPHHISTLSIHKCMKSPENQQHMVGAMTISPIKISQNFPVAMRRPIPVALPKTVLNWPPLQTSGGHFIDRKRVLPRESSNLFDELVRKKAAATATMESVSAAAQDLQTKQKPESHHVYRHTIEHLATNQPQKNDSTLKNDTGPQLHPLMMVHSGNPFLQDKRAHQPQMLNRGNITINMNKVSSNDASPKWHPGRDCCNNNCNGNGKLNPNVVSAVPVSSHFQSQAFLNQARKNIQVNRILPAIVPTPNTPITSDANSTTQNEQQSQSDSDCTIIN